LILYLILIRSDTNSPTTFFENVRIAPTRRGKPRKRALWTRIFFPGPRKKSAAEKPPKTTFFHLWGPAGALSPRIRGPGPRYSKTRPNFEERNHARFSNLVPESPEKNSRSPAENGKNVRDARKTRISGSKPTGFGKSAWMKRF